MKMFVADSLVEKLEAEVNRLYMRGHVAAEHHVQNHALRIVYDEPTVDAEPVRHGRWIAVPSSDVMTGKAYKCSECNKMRYGSFMPNYCQNCGAKMDGEADV